MEILYEITVYIYTSLLHDLFVLVHFRHGQGKLGQAARRHNVQRRKFNHGAILQNISQRLVAVHQGVQVLWNLLNEQSVRGQLCLRCLTLNLGQRTTEGLLDSCRFNYSGKDTKRWRCSILGVTRRRSVIYCWGAAIDHPLDSPVPDRVTNATGLLLVLHTDKCRALLVLAHIRRIIPH